MNVSIVGHEAVFMNGRFITHYQTNVQARHLTKSLLIRYSDFRKFYKLVKFPSKQPLRRHLSEPQLRERMSELDAFMTHAAHLPISPRGKQLLLELLQVSDPEIGALPSYPSSDEESEDEEEAEVKAPKNSAPQSNSSSRTPHQVDHDYGYDLETYDYSSRSDSSSMLDAFNNEPSSYGSSASNQSGKNPMRHNLAILVARSKLQEQQRTRGMSEPARPIERAEIEARNPNLVQSQGQISSSTISSNQLTDDLQLSFRNLTTRED